MSMAKQITVSTKEICQLAFLKEVVLNLSMKGPMINSCS